MGICYVAVRWITCSCYECLRKLYSPWNRNQDKYNQDQYKGDNHKCAYSPILGPYNSFQIITFIAGRKEHEAPYTDINVYIR